MRRITRAATPVALLVGLAACGGGGASGFQSQDPHGYAACQGMKRAIADSGSSSKAIADEEKAAGEAKSAKDAKISGAVIDPGGGVTGLDPGKITAACSAHGVKLTFPKS